MTKEETLKAAIRDIHDFPKPGIVFKDITPILGNGDLFRKAIDVLAERHRDSGIDRIAAVDARGFLFAGAMCDRLGAGLVPIRKQGKLPHVTFEESYDLEYGSATLAIHQDAFLKGDRVLLVDDLLATGGTAEASAKLIEQAGGTLVEVEFLVELSFLGGREKLSGYSVYAPIVY
jgi:adenine phosphoribosyltransferase